MLAHNPGSGHLFKSAPSGGRVEEEELMHKARLSACEPRFLSASAPSRLIHSPAWASGLPGPRLVGQVTRGALSCPGEGAPYPPRVSAMPATAISMATPSSLPFTHPCAHGVERQSAPKKTTFRSEVWTVSLLKAVCLTTFSLELVPSYGLLIWF